MHGFGVHEKGSLIPEIYECRGFRRRMERMECGKEAGGNFEMKGFIKSRPLLVVLRFVLGGLFLYAGVMKSVNPQMFAYSIAAFDIVPTRFVNLVAHSLPLMEALLGFMILLGWKLRAASLGITLLSAVFLIVLGQAVLRGLPVNCSCFGVSSPQPAWLLLGRAAMLCLAGAWLYAQNLTPCGCRPESS